MQDKPFWKSKTVWVGFAGVCAGLGAFYAGELTLYELIQAEVVPLGLIFMRLAIGK